MLEDIGRSLVGRVFVYREPPFNWLPIFANCVDEHAYARGYQYAGDYHFARTMLGAGAPWVTHNASEARLFVVPTLFGLGPDAEVGPPLHSRFVRTNASDAVPGHPRGQCSESAYEHALMETVKALKRSEFWGRVPHLFISGGFQTLSGCRRLVVNGGTHKTAESHPHGLGSTAPHGNQSNASSSSSSSHLGFQRDHCPARGLAGLHAAPRRLLFSSPRVVVGHFELDYDAGQRDLEGLVGVHVPYVANCAHGVPLCAMAGKCEPSTEWASRWAQHPLASRPMDFHLRGTGFLLNPIRLAACAALQRVESGREFVCFEAGVETRQHGNDTSALFHIEGEGDVRIDLPPCDDTRPCANRKPGERALGGACPWRVPCRGAFSSDGYCDELLRSRFSLMTSGDTPSSRRLYDALEAGTLSVTLSAGLRATLSPLVEWDAFMPDALVLASRGVAPIDIHASAAAMQRLVDESECALARRQDAMLKWLPLLSWNYDPHMTSMHVLAQTALQIRTHGWSDVL